MKNKCPPRIEPLEVSKTVAMPVTGDTVAEPDETFFVNFSNPSNAAIGDGEGRGTIGEIAIAATAKSATFSDVDGDRVTVQVNKGTLSAANFVFGADGTLQKIDTAHRIGALEIAGEKVPLTRGVDDLSLDLVNQNFRAVEI